MGFFSVFNFIVKDLTAQILLFSFILMIPLELYLAVRFKVPAVKFFFISLVSLYFSYLFARIFHAFFDATNLYGDLLAHARFKHILRYFFYPYAGGIMFYGSMTGCLLGISLIYPLLRKDKAAYLRCFDITIICFAFTAMFSRLADFASGDSYGFPFDSAFSLVYSSGSSAARQLAQRGLLEAGMPTPPLFPTQPIMVAAKIIIFFILLLKSFKDKKKVPLSYVALYFSIYCPYRFCIDFLRYDRAAYFLGLTTSQWLSIIFAGWAVYYYKVLYPRFKVKYCK
ncbi:prolipoprotein diacylglyceryl transferase [bacterium]|nr:prolipoprotein diacylglyceryl transferase [bacterium]